MGEQKKPTTQNTSLFSNTFDAQKCAVLAYPMSATGLPHFAKAAIPSN